MASNTARMFAPIEKTEEQDDGTLKVWGYASTESVDSDGETITAEAMKAALPDYLKFGAVREMHKSNAVGTAIEAEVQDDGRTWFGAHVVDSEAVKKVRANVFKGFSIGGRITSRDTVNKSTITGLKLVEVSLVDRPANPDAVFTMFKAESELSAIDEMARMISDHAITPERLLELAKADLTPGEEPAEEAAKAEGVDAAEIAADALTDAPDAPESIAKGLGHVSELASLLKYIAYIANDQADEAAREGDGSVIPAQLKAWLADGITILQAMTAEEAAELLACIPDAVVPVESIEMAAAADDLEKAGARNSKGDAAKLQAAHDALAAMGANCAAADKAAAVDDLAKADTLAKAETDRDEALAKAATLEARVAELEAAPAPGKAVLIDKASDGIAVETKAEQIVPESGTADRAMFELRKSLRSPLRIAN